MKCLLFFLSVSAGLILSQGLHAADIDFQRDIRPLLSRNCYACHGPDESAREAGLRLDSSDGSRNRRENGAAIVPGDAKSSLLVQRITSSDPDLRMPPADSGHALNERERKLLIRWVEAGGEYSEHWSFVVPRKKELPDVTNSKWPRHAMDHFVLAKLDEAGLEPMPEASRYRWIRRVSLQLTGLPPSLEQADEFVADQSDAAYEKVVDRLLDDPSFGEHWARMWLDLARYADTKGYEKDRPREIWRYRDWVIDAFNADMPFDQFTIEQLAGDLLPDATTDQLLATAFHRNTMTNEEGGTDDEEFRVAAVKDRVDTTMQVWMGLTMGCAKCHSHKFDPISQTDYYSFYAFFNQTKDADRGNESPLHRTPTRAQAEQQRALKQKIAELEKSKATAKNAQTIDAKLKKKRDELKALEAKIPQTPIMQELPAQQHRTTKIHQRGNFLDQGDVVNARVPTHFGSLPKDVPNNRLGVARWLVHENNPLTSRVIVNRIWARLFGVGLVETEEDFGAQGTPPVNQPLLDWLAVDFREQGWSVKSLLKTIVLSSAYRQSARLTDAAREKDPRNRLLSRGPRFRLSAETVRDQALAVSGLLTGKQGGPSVMPPQPPGVWKSTYSALKWKSATGPDRFRRGLYTYWKRTSPYPAMMTFDAGSGEVCQIRRVRTNTPLQALVTLNDPAFFEAAGALAARMSEFDGSVAQKLEYGLRRALIRPATKQETDRLTDLYSSLQQDFATNTTAANELLKFSKSQSADAAMVSVANVLLNLDEFLMH